jgi:tetrapyrrole methylase family protein/MazG family protein
MIDIVGFGPAGLAETDPRSRGLLADRDRIVIARTGEHPAVDDLLHIRDVRTCDDLYDVQPTFEAVYAAIAERVVTAAVDTDVVYAVPGSPLVGEFAVASIRSLAGDRGLQVQVHPAESFVDAMCRVLEIDPLRSGLKLLDGHDLPNPLIFDVPTIVGHLGTA